MLPWHEHDHPLKEHVTVWTIFPASTNYLDPSHTPFMINHKVDDLDALLDCLQQEGVKNDPKRMNESYGRFASSHLRSLRAQRHCRIHARSHPRWHENRDQRYQREQHWYGNER